MEKSCLHLNWFWPNTLLSSDLCYCLLICSLTYKFWACKYLRSPSLQPHNCVLQLYLLKNVTLYQHCNPELVLMCDLWAISPPVYCVMYYSQEFHRAYSWICPSLHTKFAKNLLNLFFWQSGVLSSNYTNVNDNISGLMTASIFYSEFNNTFFPADAGLQLFSKFCPQVFLSALKRVPGNKSVLVRQC